MDLLEENGWSALMIASQNGHGEVVKILLENGAEVDLQALNEIYELGLTSKKVNDFFINILRDHSIECETESIRYSVALEDEVQLERHKIYHFAKFVNSHEGHTEVWQLLKENGAQVHDENIVYADLPENILKVNSEVYKVALNKTRINLHLCNGYTALTLASLVGHSDTVEILLENGAEINKQMKNGMSALMLASQRGHAEVVKVLLKHGALVNLTNIHNLTSLMLASEVRNQHVVLFWGKLISPPSDYQPVLLPCQPVSSLGPHIPLSNQLDPPTDPHSSRSGQPDPPTDPHSSLSDQPDPPTDPHRFRLVGIGLKSIAVATPMERTEVMMTESIAAESQYKVGGIVGAGTSQGGVGHG